MPRKKVRTPSEFSCESIFDSGGRIMLPESQPESSHWRSLESWFDSAAGARDGHIEIRAPIADSGGPETAPG
jgi:hypothetical protein